MTIDARALALTTERLALRPFREADFPAYAGYHALPEVYRYLYMPAPAGEALRLQFDTALGAPFAHDGDTLRLAVTLVDRGTLLGEVLLKHANRAARQAEFGYIFDPRHGGRGYATEAVAALITAAFDAFGMHRLFARLDPLNAGSVGVVERLGLRREAHLIENDRNGDAWGDEYIYAVLAREWRARGGSLRAQPLPDA